MMHKGPSASRKIMMKSISVEDLATIVKQMISGALDDTEQIEKLHRAIYEELYFEKIGESDNVTVEQSSTKSSTQNILKIELTSDTDDCNELEKCTNEESNTNCTQESEGFIFNGQDDNHKIDKKAIESAEILIKKSKIQGQKTEETTITNAIKQSERSLDENAQRNEEAFDIWRKEKTKVMRQIAKEERRKKEEELVAKQEEIEKKRANHEAYLRSKKLLEKRKLDDTQRRAMREDNSRMQEEENARVVANEEAFKAWIKQKNSKSAQRYSQPRRYRPQTGRTRYCSDAEFDSWLDQLDSVLHQKYLRERRYRVRSFYCQPAYYGTAALCMQ